MDGNFRFIHVYSKLTRPQLTIQGSTTRPRVMNGLVLYIDGSASLQPETSNTRVNAGSLLYYPAGACYQVAVTVPQTCYHQIEYMIEDDQGCPVALSHEPFVFFQDCPAVYRLKIAELVRAHSQGGLGHSIKLNAMLYDLMYNLALAVVSEL